MLRLTLLWEFPECKFLAFAFGWTPDGIPLKKRVALHSYCKFALIRAHQTGKRFSDFQIPENEITNGQNHVSLHVLRERGVDHLGF